MAQHTLRVQSAGIATDLTLLLVGWPLFGHMNHFTCTTCGQTVEWIEMPLGVEVDQAKIILLYVIEVPQN